MAFTQAQLAALEEAIAAGQVRVQYGDKLVQYASLDEMLKLRQQMKDELAAGSSAATDRFSRVAFDRG